MYGMKVEKGKEFSITKEQAERAITIARVMMGSITELADTIEERLRASKAKKLGEAYVSLVNQLAEPHDAERHRELMSGMMNTDEQLREIWESFEKTWDEADPVYGKLVYGTKDFKELSSLESLNENDKWKVLFNDDGTVTVKKGSGEVTMRSGDVIGERGGLPYEDAYDIRMKVAQIKLVNKIGEKMAQRLDEFFARASSEKAAEAL